MCKIGDNIKIKKGASKTMKELGYWADFLGDCIDNKYGKIIGFGVVGGDCELWTLDMGFDDVVGVPKFMVEIN